MGNILDILHYGENVIATEAAEDITKQLDTDVNDILGTHKDDESSDSPDDTSSNKDDQSDDSSTNSDDTPDTASDDTNTDDASDTGDDTSDDSIEDDTVGGDKVQLYDKMKFLYDTLGSNIEVLSNYSPDSADEDSIKILNNVKDHFGNCKDILGKTISDEFKNSEYTVLLKKYIGICRVYDLCIKILDKYFNNVSKELDLKAQNKSKPVNNKK